MRVDKDIYELLKSRRIYLSKTGKSKMYWSIRAYRPTPYSSVDINQMISPYDTGRYMAILANGQFFDRRRENIIIVPKKRFMVREVNRNENFKSRYHDVYYDPIDDKFIAVKYLNTKRFHIGTYDTELEAALAADEVTKRIGILPYLNFRNENTEISADLEERINKFIGELNDKEPEELHYDSTSGKNGITDRVSSRLYRGKPYREGVPERPDTIIDIYDTPRKWVGESKVASKVRGSIPCGKENTGVQEQETGLASYPDHENSMENTTELDRGGSCNASDKELKPPADIPSLLVRRRNGEDLLRKARRI